MPTTLETPPPIAALSVQDAAITGERKSLHGNVTERVLRWAKATGTQESRLRIAALGGGVFIVVLEGQRLCGHCSRADRRFAQAAAKFDRRSCPFHG